MFVNVPENVTIEATFHVEINVNVANVCKLVAINLLNYWQLKPECYILME